MPFGEVELIPGVNTERTPTLNEAGVSASQLIRYKDSLIQKYGGWTPYYQFTVATTPRDLHGWDDLDNLGHLAIGATNGLQIITSGAVATITPQILTSNFSNGFSTVANSTTVTVTDTNIANVTIFDAVLLDTPVSVGGIVLSGLFPLVSITGASSYTINSPTPAISSATGTGTVPTFTPTLNSQIVSVNIATHGLSAGSTVVFPIPTTGDGITISGDYSALSITDANNFSISAAAQASATTVLRMNNGSAQVVYYLNLGPTLAGQGYGIGAYGAGLYGLGTAGGTSQVGTPITAADWTSDNWGEILLECPKGGGVYQYDPTGGFSNAGLVATAPPFNGGIFVSTTQQVLICWASTTNEDIGVIQDPLLVKWSTVGDYTNFAVLATDQAGSFRIPRGSKIMAGAAVANQDLIWTDLDLWAMNYIGPPDVFGFNQIGAGAGAISSHAVQSLRGNVYWMGQNNFYALTSNGVAVLPCSVWDFVFQNINLNYTQNVRAMPNTPFNECGWLFPSSASATGECDSYVKMNITEPNAPWDYGSLSRSAWIDQGALGMPIAATPQGNVYQHETTNDAAGAALNASFTTGYFMIAEGEDFVMVDQIYPDFKWGFYPGTSGATILMTFYVVNYPGDSPQVFGPYSVTSSTEFFTTRMRGRQMAIEVQNLDTGSFWRLGKVRYRYQQSVGRR
jgi:hypothetical protein